MFNIQACAQPHGYFVSDLMRGGLVFLPGCFGYYQPSNTTLNMCGIGHAHKNMHTHAHQPHRYRSLQ